MPRTPTTLWSPRPPRPHRYGRSGGPTAILWVRGFLRAPTTLWSPRRGHGCHSPGIVDQSGADWAGDDHRQASPPAAFYLVEVDWPSGSRRYAARSVTVGDVAAFVAASELVGYDGVLLSLTAIELGKGKREDTVTFELVSVSDHELVEASWNDVNPPEGSAVRVYLWFEGETLTERRELFRGVVDEVSDLSGGKLRVTAASAQEHDVEVVDLAATSEYPDLPQGSVGQPKPIVLGTVDGVELLPVTTVGRSTLAQSALDTDATLYLDDASTFPSSGSVYVGDEGEVVTYTGKSGDNLTGCTRGASSTTARAYGRGATVVEVTAWTLMASDRQATAVLRVRAFAGERRRELDPSEYSVQLSPKALVTITNGVPLVPVPSGDLAFCYVELDAAGAGNAATNATNAAGAHANWSQKNYATIDSGHTPLELKRSTAVAPLGEIVRVWAVAEYDASTLPNEVADTDEIWLRDGSGTEIGTAFDSDGNLPAELKQRAGLGTARAYDDEHTIDNPTHSHAESNVTEERFLDWVTGTSADQNNVIDRSVLTLANIVFGESLSVGSSYSFGSPGALVRYRYKMDYVANSGTIQLASYKLGSNVATNSFASISRTTEATSWVSTTTWSDLYASNTYATLVLTAGDDIDIYQIWLEVEYTPAAGAAIAQPSAHDNDDPLTHTYAWLVDVTSTVAGSWAWFTDAELQAHYKQVGADDGDTTRINRLYFLVEYSPTRSEPADRVLADVEGIAPAGTVAQNLVLLVEDVAGRPRGTLDPNDLHAAHCELSAAGLRLDTVLRARERLRDLVDRFCAQARLTWFWEQGTIRVRYQRNLGSLPTPAKTMRDADVVVGSLRRSRSVLRDVVTELRATYRYSDEYGTDERSLLRLGDQLFGSRPEDVALDLVRDDATAQAYAQSFVERRELPRWNVWLRAPLPWLDLRRGDMVALALTDFQASYAEVQSMRVDKGTVELSFVVWDDLRRT